MSSSRLRSDDVGSYPAIAGKPWCGSLKDVDWRGHGYDGRQLGALLPRGLGFSPPATALTPMSPPWSRC